MKEGAPGLSLLPKGRNLPSDGEKPESRTCGECGAAVNLTEARLENGRDDVGIGVFRGLLAASVMTAFFGLLVLIGFVLGKMS